MSLKSRICLGLGLSLSLVATVVSAEKPRESFSLDSQNTTVTAIDLDPGSFDTVIEQNKKLTYNWNHYTTSAATQKQVADTEKFLSRMGTANGLNHNNQEALGHMLYKMGTYYLYVSHELDKAQAKLTMANSFLFDKHELAWNYNQLAYVYEQKFAFFDHPADREKALYYTKKVTAELFPKTNNHEVAFAYSIMGATQNDAKEFTKAKDSLQKSLAIYEALPGGPKDEQYNRTQSILASVMLDENGQEQQAFTMLKQFKGYWSRRLDSNFEITAANNLVNLGRAYIKLGNYKAARTEIEASLTLYSNMFGTQSQALVKPYQILAESYLRAGSINEAASYEKKADDLDVNTVFKSTAA